MATGLVIALCLVLLFLSVLLIGAGTVLAHEAGQRRRGWHRAAGQVKFSELVTAGRRSAPFPGASRSRTVYNTVEFTPRGGRQPVTLRTGEARPRPTNEPVTVYYDPADPGSRATLATPLSEQAGAFALAAFGVVCFLAPGAIVYVYFFRR